jgi:hypothetical protein
LKDLANYEQYLVLRPFYIQPVISYIGYNNVMDQKLYKIAIIFGVNIIHNKIKERTRLLKRKALL